MLQQCWGMCDAPRNTLDFTAGISGRIKQAAALHVKTRVKDNPTHHCGVFHYSMYGATSTGCIYVQAQQSTEEVDVGEDCLYVSNLKLFSVLGWEIKRQFRDWLVFFFFCGHFSFSPYYNWWSRPVVSGGFCFTLWQLLHTAVVGHELESR